MSRRGRQQGRGVRVEVCDHVDDDQRYVRRAVRMLAGVRFVVARDGGQNGAVGTGDRARCGVSVLGVRVRFGCVVEQGGRCVGQRGAGLGGPEP
jgi:hypothetical protein